MKPFILLLNFIIFVSTATCFSQTYRQHNKPLPVLDKTKSYPSKKLEFDTQVTYVPLETSKDVLLDGPCRLRFVSNEKIILADEIRGDVFIFDKSGKILSNFNQKGGLGYTFITCVAYDEKRNELFILDRIKKKVFVFSEKGTLLRNYNIPQKTNVQEIYNFDDETLLAFNEDMFGSDQKTKPYFYISKNDGKLIGYVNIELEKVNPISYIENVGKNEDRSYVFTHTGTADNCKFGNDFILANKSMDTIYLLKQNKTLTPLFAQTPSVYSEHPTAASVGMITDQFLKICVSDYDILEGVKIMKAGGNWKPKFRNFILDINTGEFFEDSDYKKYTISKVDTPKNQDYRLMQALNLVNANKKGLLNGELKELALKLEIGDNPVLQITKFK